MERPRKKESLSELEKLQEQNAHLKAEASSSKRGAMANRRRGR